MRQRYRQAMEWLYLACIVLSGVGLVAITLIIPSGVFMRYVMNDPLQWPEPASVIMMVAFSFIGGAAVYRANVHIAVETLVHSVGPKAQRALRWASDACMIAIALFMLVYGVHLCELTWGNTIAEFPGLSVGVVYLPIPISGLLTLLFIFERQWLGPAPQSSIMYRDSPVEVE